MLKVRFSQFEPFSQENVSENLIYCDVVVQHKGILTSLEIQIKKKMSVSAYEECLGGMSQAYYYLTPQNTDNVTWNW